MTKGWVVGYQQVHTTTLPFAGCGCAMPVSRADMRCHAPSHAEPAPTRCAGCKWNQEVVCGTTAQMHRPRSPSDRRPMSTVTQSQAS